MSHPLLDASVHLHVHSRNTTSLDGTWQVVPDPYAQFGDEGSFGGDRIFDPAHDTGQPDDAVVDDGYEVAVPGCWNEELPAFEQYEGAMWYARRVDWDGRSDRAFLAFGAVNYRADVWLNGTNLGSHEGGFTPFAFEVTDHLEDRADNLLVVRVDDTRSNRAVPDERTDWFTFGGITREVDLVTVPRRFLRNVKVETDVGVAEVEVSVRAWVDSSSSPSDERSIGSSEDGSRTVPEVSIPGLDSSWSLESSDDWAASPHHGTDDEASGTVYEGSATLPRDDVELWRPADPVLYDLHVAMGTDQIGERIGLRSISTAGSDVLLNGEPIRLRGVSLHEEADGRGRSLRPVDRSTRFEWLADLGCNFARLAHYPHHPAMARRADEEGVLLWAEVPAYWSVDFADEDVQGNYRQQVRELVQRDWNRPSVAMWSIANETDASDDARNEVLPEIASQVRTLDGTRLVTAACFMHETDDGRYTIEDPLAAHLDVFGVNEYQGWYEGDARDMERFDDDPSGPPVVLSEFGAGAEYGYVGDATERWTEQYQAAFYREQLEVLDEIDQCCGLSPWLLFDFRSPRRQNPHQRGYNRKGLLDESGRKKAAFDVLRRYYQS